jgi:tetratricopeptide (TPR) repeat protein
VLTWAVPVFMHSSSGEALRTCAQGLKLDGEDAELWFRKAVVHRHRGERAEAERCWRLVLNLKRTDQFCIFDQGIYGHVTRRNLAALAVERGDHAEARQLWQDVLAEHPDDREESAKLERLRPIEP